MSVPPRRLLGKPKIKVSELPVKKRASTYRKRVQKIERQQELLNRINEALFLARQSKLDADFQLRQKKRIAKDPGIESYGKNEAPDTEAMDPNLDPYRFFQESVKNTRALKTAAKRRIKSLEWGAAHNEEKIKHTMNSLI